MEQASVDDVRAMIEKGALVVDVRSPGEFASGHYRDALNIPHTEIKARLAELGSKEKPIVLYCRSGRRSGIALEEIAEAGFSHAVNAGGFSDMPETG